MLPSFFGENLFDEMFHDAFDMTPAFRRHNPLYGKRAANLMKTDVRETKDSYEIFVDLPGYKKEEVQLDLQDGYLTISASRGVDREQKDDDGHYIRQERYTGQCSRSFFIGEEIQPDQVHASFEDGILKITMPKSEAKELPKHSSIAIE